MCIRSFYAHQLTLAPSTTLVNRDVDLHTVDSETRLWKGGTHIHTANKWQGQDSNLGPSKPRELSLVLTAHTVQALLSRPAQQAVSSLRLSLLCGVEFPPGPAASAAAS